MAALYDNIGVYCGAPKFYRTVRFASDHVAVKVLH